MVAVVAVLPARIWPVLSSPIESTKTLDTGADTAVACSHVRLLSVDISSDLSLDHHVSHICAGRYYQLRQLRCIWQSLDSNSLATLVYAVVNSRIDYCNTILLVHRGQSWTSYSVC